MGEQITSPATYASYISPPVTCSFPAQLHLPPFSALKCYQIIREFHFATQAKEWHCPHHHRPTHPLTLSVPVSVFPPSLSSTHPSRVCLQLSSCATCPWAQLSSSLLHDVTVTIGGPGILQKRLPAGLSLQSKLVCRVVRLHAIIATTISRSTATICLFMGLQFSSASFHNSLLLYLNNNRQVP